MKEREKFEESYKKLDNETTFRRDSTGDYCYEGTRIAWLIWQAALSAATAPTRDVIDVELTPNQRRSLSHGLSALETMAGLWASEIRLSALSGKLAQSPDETRAKGIAAMIEQAFIEGAYRHYLDHKAVDVNEKSSNSVVINDSENVIDKPEPNDELRAAAEVDPVAYQSNKNRQDIISAEQRQILVTKWHIFDIPLYTRPPSHLESDWDADAETDKFVRELQSPLCRKDGE